MLLADPTTIGAIRIRRKKRINAVYLAYGDESHDDKCERAYAVAAVFGSEEDWCDVEGRWLKRTGGVPSHATDCENDRGSFKNKSHQDNLDLYKDLVQIVVKSRLCGMAVAISLHDYHLAFPSALANQPYYLCFDNVVQRTAHLAAMSIPRGNVKFTFHRNFEVEYNATFMYDHLRTSKHWDDHLMLHEEISFASIENPRIQVADLVARESMKFLDNQEGPVKRDLRRSMQSLAATRRFDIEAFTKEYFKDMQAKFVQAPGHSMEEYHLWRENADIPDTSENRIKYHRYLDSIEHPDIYRG